MEILQLKYFCDAAETENFSKTAKKFLVPISNISQTIKRLENELGIELFNHNGNRVALNSNGKEFYSYASQALTLLENGKAAMSDLKNNFSGDIRLVFEAINNTAKLAIEKFLKEYPKVNFIISQSSAATPNFDILISDIFPSEHSKNIVLEEEEIYVIMNKEHPLAGKAKLSVSDLENEHFVALTATASLKGIMISECEKAGFSPTFAVQTYSAASLRKYIGMGVGISFVPAYWAKKYSTDFAFKKIDGISRKTYAFLPKKKCVPQCVEAFFEMLRAEVESNA